MAMIFTVMIDCRKKVHELQVVHAGRRTMVFWKMHKHGNKGQKR